jgi:hypothetical protein
MYDGLYSWAYTVNTSDKSLFEPTVAVFASAKRRKKCRNSANHPAHLHPHCRQFPRTMYCILIAFKSATIFSNYVVIKYALFRMA